MITEAGGRAWSAAHVFGEAAALIDATDLPLAGIHHEVGIFLLACARAQAGGVNGERLAHARCGLIATGVTSPVRRSFTAIFCLGFCS
jgi:hypothetical protein